MGVAKRRAALGGGSGKTSKPRREKKTKEPKEKPSFWDPRSGEDIFETGGYLRGRDIPAAMKRHQDAQGESIPPSRAAPKNESYQERAERLARKSMQAAQPIVEPPRRRWRFW